MTYYPRSRGVPLWKHEHQKRQKDISTLLKYLQDAPGDIITQDDQLESTVELNPLDYTTGITKPSVIPFFGRRHDLRLPQKANLAKIQRRLRQAEPLRQSEKDIKLREALAFELDLQVGRHYRQLEGSNKAPYEWTDLINNYTRGKKFSLDETKSPCKVRRAVEVVETRRNHRMAVVEMMGAPDPSQPTITELQVLLQLMRSGDWDRRSIWELKEGQRVSVRKRAHYVVPTLLVTVHSGGQTRVMWGYFDEKLKVQYTELEQSSRNVAKSLDNLIQWALPVIRGDTTRNLAMPSIAESDKEEDEDGNGPQLETLTEESDEDLSLGEKLREQVVQVYEHTARGSAWKLGKKRSKNQGDGKQDLKRRR